jgi:UDP-N-acetylmuramoylalanine--D-glutamate ligase
VPTANSPSSSPDSICGCQSGQRSGSLHSAQTAAGLAELRSLWLASQMRGIYADGEDRGMKGTSTKPRPPLPAGPYLVVGLARSGQAAARALAARGERVTGVDAASPEGASELGELGVDVQLDADGTELVDRAGCVVKSPGVPREAPAVAAALERGVEVIGELELAWRLLPNRFVGVTGTNGKTTVTELLGHVWRTAGDPVAVAGNVGTPLASLVGEVGADATVICECSSFQLEDADAFAPECALLLNVSPDHLDRHRDIDDYTDAKLRIFARQIPGDWAIFDSSEPGLAGRKVGVRARLVDLADAPIDGFDGALAGSALIGPHNARNARAAAAVALAMGIDRETVAEALRTFPGVPHRLERVAEIRGVAYVNDSKATNVAAAAAALRSFEGGVRAILGGSLKGGGFAELAEPVAERCEAVYLIGPAAEALERDLAPALAAGVEVRRCDDLADAVSIAAADAQPGEVVLLSPACASFDAYRDYEQRGEHFRELVTELRA